MNVFSVHSIGWVATRDLCSDFFRKRLGLAPRFDSAALGRVAGRWEALSAAVSNDRHTAGLVMRLAYPRRVPLSAGSVAALRAFIEELVAAAPGLYSRAALRERCLSRCVNFLGSSLVCLMIGHSAPAGSHAAGSAIASFFVIACWSLATAAQLFNAFKVVDSLAPGKPREDRQAGAA
jgi:hypothetical protein